MADHIITKCLSRVQAIRGRLNATKVVLNKNQCEKLLKVLQATTDAIKNILSPLLASDPSSKLLRFIEHDLNVVVLKAKDVVEACCSKKWWLAAVFQMDNEDTFKDIIVDLKCCFDTVSAYAADNGHVHISAREILDFGPVTEDELEEDRKLMEERCHSSCSGKKLSGFFGLGRDSQRELVLQLSARLHWIRTKRKDGGGVPDIFQVEERTLACPSFCGKGGSASVSQGTWLGVECAKKVFSTNIENYKAYVDNESIFKQEVGTLARLNHPNIVKFLGHGMRKEKSKWERFIVMELMERSLDRVVQDLSDGGTRVPFTYGAAVDVMLQVAKAMRYLHSQGIDHRDLKPGNVLVSGSRFERSGVGQCAYVKVADFGLSRIDGDSVGPYEFSSEKPGTTLYRAPEMGSMSSPVVPHKADVYSFGIMCSEVLSGKVPFLGVARGDLLDRLKEGLRPDLPTNFDGLVLLIRECWRWEAVKRPGFPEICHRLTKLKIEILKGVHEVMPAFKNEGPQTIDLSAAESQCVPAVERTTEEDIVNPPESMEARILPALPHQFVSIKGSVSRLEKILQIVPVIGIIGMGGIGKTTLAKALFLDIHRKFDAVCFLPKIKVEKDLLPLLNDIFQDLGHLDKITNMEKAQVVLKRLFRTKKVLLVLDDVDSKKQLDGLLPQGLDFGNGSRIIITSRNWLGLRGHVQEEGKFEVLRLEEECVFSIRNKEDWNLHQLESMPNCDTSICTPQITCKNKHVAIRHHALWHYHAVLYWSSHVCVQNKVPSHKSSRH